jgi:hypothetical protein
MELDALLAELDRRRALFVHFSHLSYMRLGGVFPDDLQAAVAKKARWTLSCCVVWPGHTMNLPGQVGLIFRPTATDQILSGANSDSGSGELPWGEELSGGDGLTPEMLAGTFSVAPGDYSEWRVRGAEVSGIFVTSTIGVMAKKRQPLVVDGMYIGEEIWPAALSLAQVKAAFPDLDLKMTDNGPVVVA